jgi:uncharacterized membrane protein
MASQPGYPGAYGMPPRRRGGLRWIFVGIGVGIVVLGALFLALSYDPVAFGLRAGWGFPYGGGFFGVFLILWGSLMLVRVAFWASRRGRGGGPAGRRFDPAILEARRRYARGEITREQFEQIVSDLRRHPGAPPGPLP